MKTKLRPGWVLALLCTVLFFYGFYLGGVQLVISEVSREYGQNAAGMGGLVAAQHVAAVVLPVVLGTLADRIGKKPVLCIFAAVFAVGCFLAGLSKNLGVYVIGTASLGAAIAIKRFLETQKCPGTVILFGCPGEEGGSGKAFMARDGVFDELDAALCWHPDENTGVRVQTSLANCQVLYKFNGKAAHAGAEPHLGRSALDAVELMDVGANYLREHMIDQARVHYAITDAGGFSPNVVQPHAEVLYLIRAPRSAQVKELYERVNDIARGAALMTGTTVEIDFVKACSDTILNDTLQRVLYEKMAQIGVPEITEADEAFARELTETALMEYPKADPVHPIHDELLPYTGQIEYECGSTDVGDVSWVCPTVQAKAATWAFGTPCHSWQAVTQGIMPLAHKMTLYIAKSLAAMGAELMVNAELLERAKQEHRRLVGPEGYVCPIPKGVKPRSMDSLHK